MKLGTCLVGQEEKWGVIVDHPVRGEKWIFFPGACEAVFADCAANATNGMHGCLRAFAPPGGWPDSLAGLLALEEEGMNALRAFERHLLTFIGRADQYAVETAGAPLSAVTLCPPVPRPRLMWGLVQNCPSFWRKNPQRKIANFMPQGHQRPVGSLVGEGGLFDTTDGYNVELGVVIGKKGRDIPVERAREYVAGYTVVIDGHVCSFWVDQFGPGLARRALLERYPDWYLDATTSWAGKMADAHCAVGPWLVTEDEIGDVYDLLVYTLADGVVRDRSHTAGMSIGVERTIHFYSTFGTLYPGDVIHMGTMGTDGLKPPAGRAIGPDTLLQAEIERIGRLSVHLVDTIHGPDWRAPEEQTRPIAPSDRFMRDNGLDVLAGPWTPSDARSAWMCFGNYRDSESVEGMKPTPYPRFLDAPAACAGQGGEIRLAARAGRLGVDVQLAAVVKKMASRVSPEEAADCIEGYCAAACVTDYSIRDGIIEPATPQERSLSVFYGRWGDGYNQLGQLGHAPAPGARMTLEVGSDRLETTLDEYRHGPAEIISFISRRITLYPGDIVFCGRLSRQIPLPREACADGVRVRAEIDGLPAVETQIIR